MSVFESLRKESKKQIHKPKTGEDYIRETSQRELASGILKQSAQDLRRFHGATGAVERELYRDAYRWVISDDCSWPFSFLNVCQLLNLSPESLRQELLTDESLGLVGYLARRSGTRCAFVSSFLHSPFYGEPPETNSGGSSSSYSHSNCMKTPNQGFVQRLRRISRPIVRESVYKHNPLLIKQTSRIQFPAAA